ncbi:MAG: T9SS type A sorting domain-containing protein [Flavobacteriales bacterium]|nr:T9SS type A sorting domain-containing protein [Flavobacteriales bacterium]
MRRFIFILIQLAVFCQVANAQNGEWFATGTTWTYFYEFNPPLPVLPNTANIDFTITEQTALNGTECSKMDVPAGEENPFNHFSVIAPYYFYESNDSVFYATDYDPTFRLAFDFNAEPGDSWLFIVPVEVFDEVDTFLVTVNDVSTTNINGEELRVLDLTYDNISPVEHTWILQNPIDISVTERLGSPVLFFVPFGEAGGEIAAVDGPFNIQCYASEALNYLNPDFESCVLSTDEQVRNSDLKIYPNPAETDLFVRIPTLQNRIDRLEVYDTQGRLVQDYSITRSSEDGMALNISSLHAGMYVVRAWSDGRAYAQKAIVGPR